MERAGERVGRWLGAYFDWSEEQQEIAAFALTLLISNLFTLALLAALAAAAGVLPQALVMAASAGALKAFAGGAHFSTGWRCGVVSALAATGAAQVAAAAGPFLVQALAGGPGVLLAVALGAAVAAVMGRYAPVDVPAKPITSPRQRARLRAFAVALSLLWTALSAALFAAWGPGHVRSEWMGTLWLASAIGFLWESFSVLPPGMRFVCWLDRRIERVIHRNIKEELTMKRILSAAILALLGVVAAANVASASAIFWHQPKVPKVLVRK